MSSNDGKKASQRGWHIRLELDVDSGASIENYTQPPPANYLKPQGAMIGQSEKG